MGVPNGSIGRDQPLTTGFHNQLIFIAIYCDSGVIPLPVISILHAAAHHCHVVVHVQVRPVAVTRLSLADQQRDSV